MKKIILIFALFSIVMNGNAQSDSVLKQSLGYSTKDYSTKGIYVSGAYFSGIFSFIPDDTTGNFNFYAGLNSSLQLELKRNLAINVWYAFTPKSNYQNTWFDNKITIIGSNINFPLYKYDKHFGFYMIGGISRKQITGYYTTSSNPWAQSKYQEYSPYIITKWGAETGIGFEYKINYLQFHSLFKYRFDGETESVDFIIGARFKISKLFKNPKQRYRWF